VANDVTEAGAGFNVDTNIVTLFSRDRREQKLPLLSKAEIAHKILDEVLRLRIALRSKPAVQRAGD
jgi:phosphopantothenoylcysteine decarboxylase/phosphopantothenate--cysteine ligase